MAALDDVRSALAAVNTALPAVQQGLALVGVSELEPIVPELLAAAQALTQLASLGADLLAKKKFDAQAAIDQADVAFDEAMNAKFGMPKTS